MASCLSNVLGCLFLLCRLSFLNLLQCQNMCRKSLTTSLTSNWIRSAVVIKRWSHFPFVPLLLLHGAWSWTLMFAHEVRTSTSQTRNAKSIQTWELCFLDLVLLTSFSSFFMLLFSPLFSQAVWWHVFACSPSPTGMQSKGEMKPRRKRAHMQRKNEDFKTLNRRLMGAGRTWKHLNLNVTWISDTVLETA